MFVSSSESDQRRRDSRLLTHPIQFEFDPRNLERGTLVAEQAAKAVTFVENHDDQYLRGLDSHVRSSCSGGRLPLRLLRRLLRPSRRRWTAGGQAAGREWLDLLIKVPKQFAPGEERY
jgi:hypothetical protein